MNIHELLRVYGIWIGIENNRKIDITIPVNK